MMLAIRARRTLALVALVCFASSRSAPAHAQTGDPAVIATARSLAIAGVQLADAGRCAEALPDLQRAEELHHAPVVVFYLGVCHIQLGRLLQGSEILRDLLRQPRPAQPNRAVEDAYDRAARLLEEVEPKLASITVLLDAPPGTAPTIKLDGDTFPPVMLGVARTIDPGEHALEAHAPGLASTLQKVIIAPGQARVVSIALNAPSGNRNAPRPGSPAPASDAGVADDTTPLENDSSLTLKRVPAFIAWGIGAAALFVGAGYGWAALNGSEKLDQRCPQRLCPKDAQPRLESERTHATISTLAFAVAAAGGLAGTILYLTTDDAEETGPTQRPPQPAAASLRVGLSGVELGLTFD